tara:strand:- start:236911 stop:237729 length:819 start_codon:yes stop_codon:yes gene_type:complete
MSRKSKDVHNQFQGYLNTSLLWTNTALFGLQQFEMPHHSEAVINEDAIDELRLGKRVEQFVSQELKQCDEIEILRENTQIQHNKRTIGELDCILIHNKIPIHLEIVYKFYLFDHSEGLSEIEKWIGPNRNDTLLKKLTKLKSKQLQLLYSEYTKPLLDALGLTVESIHQQVFFKAQLFVPYNEKVPEFELLNNACLSGFYIRLSEINQLNNCEFFIPTKVNWLIEIQRRAPWMNFTVFSEEISAIVNEKTSPLCWVKFPNGTVQKFFVVWWD